MILYSDLNYDKLSVVYNIKGKNLFIKMCYKEETMKHNKYYAIQIENYVPSYVHNGERRQS